MNKKFIYKEFIIKVTNDTNIEKKLMLYVIKVLMI